MQQSSRRIVFLASLLVAFSLISCGDVPPQIEKFTCKESGPCSIASGKKSLRVALRDNEHEVFVEAVHRPYRGPLPDGTTAWCLRLVDQETGTFSSQENNNCPSEWTQGTGERRESFDFEHVYRRNASVRPLLEALKKMNNLENRKEAAHECVRHLEGVLESIDRSSQRPRSSSSLQAFVPQIDTAEPSNLDEKNQATIDDENKFGQGYVLDENGNIFYEEWNESDPEESLYGDVPPLKEPSSDLPNGSYPDRILRFSKGTPGIPKTSPTELVRKSGLEFVQQIRLCSQPLKIFLRFGW